MFLVARLPPQMCFSEIKWLGSEETPALGTTVVLAGLTCHSYNGRIAEVVGVVGDRLRILLWPEGQDLTWDAVLINVKPERCIITAAAEHFDVLKGSLNTPAGEELNIMFCTQGQCSDDQNFSRTNETNTNQFLLDMACFCSEATCFCLGIT